MDWNTLKKRFDSILSKFSNKKVIEVKKEEVKPSQTDISLLEAERTMRVLIVTKKLGYPCVCPPQNISVKKENGKVLICLHSFSAEALNIPPENFDPVNFVTEFTNDPTNEIAGFSVSLGYPCFRISLKGGKIVNLNPFAIECQEKDLEVYFNRPMRGLEEPEEEILFNRIKDPMKEYIFSNIKEVGKINGN